MQLDSFLDSAVRFRVHLRAKDAIVLLVERICL